MSYRRRVQPNCRNLHLCNSRGRQAGMAIPDDVLKVKVEVKGRTLVIAPLCRHGRPTAEALRYVRARTKHRRTYLPYTFPAVAGTHLPTPKGWKVD